LSLGFQSGGKTLGHWGALSLFLFFLSFLFAAPAWSAVELKGFRSKPGSTFSISASAFFDSPPLVGFDAVLIDVQNSSAEPQAWTLISKSSARIGLELDEQSFEMVLPVAAGSSRSFEVMIPLCSAEVTPFSAGGASISLYGPGFPRGAYASRSAKVEKTEPSIAIAVSNSMEIPADLKSSAAISRFDADVLPSDWRAYVGFDSFFIPDSELAKLQPGPRKALFEWVAQGGLLFAASADAGSFFENFRFDDSAKMEKREDGNKLVYGMGALYAVAWDGRNLSREDAAIALNRPYEAEPSDASEWSLRNKANQPDPRGKIKGILLFIYALLVGPVNLYALSRRTVLPGTFWTTGMMCLVLSVAAPLCIVLWHGYGSEGYRSAIIMFRPDSNAAVVMQDQIVKSGIVLKTDFKISEPVLIKEMENGKKGSRSQRKLEQLGNEYKGDWFSIRNVDAHFLETVRPSRERIEVLTASTNGDYIDIVSSVDSVLNELFLVDSDGRYWRGSGVRAGERARLAPSSAADFKNFWSKRRSLLTGSRRELLDRQWGTPGFFFALTEENSGHAIEALQNVDWLSDVGFFFGPYVVRGSV